MCFIFHLGPHRAMLFPPVLIFCIWRRAFPWKGTIYSQLWPKECGLCAVRVLDTKTCCTIIKPQGSLCCRAKAGVHHVAHCLTVASYGAVQEELLFSSPVLCRHGYSVVHCNSTCQPFFFFLSPNHEVSKGESKDVWLEYSLEYYLAGVGNLWHVEG